jgi:hypothetical protein
MTDFDKIVEMLTRIKAEWMREDNKGLLVIIAYGGYTGFYTKLTFNLDGALISIGAFE